MFFFIAICDCSVSFHNKPCSQLVADSLEIAQQGICDEFLDILFLRSCDNVAGEFRLHFGELSAILI